jgi:diguanylate cyclase (GGDEF)-like protein
LYRFFASVIMLEHRCGACPVSIVPEVAEMTELAVPGWPGELDLPGSPLDPPGRRSPLESSLLGLASALSLETNVEALLDRLLHEARVFTRAEAGTVLMVEGDQLRLVVAQNDSLAARLGTAEIRRRLPAPPRPLHHPSLASHVAVTGATLNVEDAWASHALGPLLGQAVDGLNEYPTRSLLAIPLRAPSGAVVGVMELINAHREPDVVVPFTADSERLARSFASLAAVAIHRAILDELTFKDPLTDLYNRRYLGLRVEEEAGRHARFGHPVSVVSLDLDQLDHVNRTAGQAGGGALLREVGALVRRHSRRFTVVARDRGDDFAIVLPNTPKAGAVTYAERIKGLIERGPFEHGALTASLGVASLPETVGAAGELMGAAYRAVADAKRRGGNRVVVL